MLIIGFSTQGFPFALLYVFENFLMCPFGPRAMTVQCEECKTLADMKFVKKVTPPDFQAKNFTPSISPNFNSFSKKKHKKLVKIEKFTPLAKILHCRQQ